jgi:hypothetical protein
MACTEGQKEAARRWYHANKEKAKASMRRYQADPDNREKINTINRRNKQAYRARQKALQAPKPPQEPSTPYYQTDRGRAATRAKAARRRRALCSWADKDLIRQIYEMAQVLTKEVGVKYHVDHVIPLRNKLVCGLHNEHNLRVIPAIDNLRKKNRFEVL